MRVFETTKGMRSEVALKVSKGISAERILQGINLYNHNARC